MVVLPFPFPYGGKNKKPEADILLCKFARHLLVIYYGNDGCELAILQLLLLLKCCLKDGAAASPP